MNKIKGFSNYYAGLSNSEARVLQQKHGKNELQAAQQSNFIFKILNFFKEPMFLLLLGTALIYFILGEFRDGIIMLVFVFFMAGINLFQEWRTDNTLQALKDLTSPMAKVIRNKGRLENIASQDLTINDLMVLEEGDTIAADGQILEMYDFGVNESALSGESEIVWKKLSASVDPQHQYWRQDYCYSGTNVTQGRAIVKVLQIGRNTEYGKISIDLLAIIPQATPLEKGIGKLIKICAFIGLVLFVLVFAITYFNQKEIIESILAAITLAMAMIPEEFPVILTVFLAMGAWRLAYKKALIRKMPAVETLGAVSVLCVDKTGTLTMNQMVVQEIYTPNEISEREFLSFATLACEPEPFDPMEQAILEYATQHSIDDKTLFAMQLVAEYPFSSESKMMGHIWRIGEDNCLSAKGSPESILPLCNLSPEIQQQLIQKQEFFAHQGYRVIAVAINKSVPTILPQLKDNPLKFIGLIALMDPPRVAVAPAIAICTKAGIRVVMITGDNGITAQSIAKKIRIPHSENIISGIDVDKMSAEELQSRVVLTNIFARVTPNQKLRIVKAFKESGQVVAMTGDGVNDAPALKYADIGIAMGKRGTVVAKEAADMILLDDNFTTIVETIHDGRRIYENIKKAIAYVFVIHIPIALIALLTPLFKIPLLLLPIHVVLLELIIDPTCSIIFERQAVDEDIMERKPRSSDESLINAALLTKAIFQGITIFAVTFGIYVFIYFQKKAQLANQGLNVELLLNTLKGHELQHFTTQLTSDARGVALLTFVFANLILVYVNQSSREYVLKSVFHSKDKVIWYINLTILLVMGLCIYTPYGNTLLQTQALNFFQILLALGLAAAATLWWEIVKLFQNTNRQKI